MLSTNSIETLYRGYDGLDLAYQAQLPTPLHLELEKSKTKAAQVKQAVLLEHNGVKLHVGESGARGGYAYIADTGPQGANWAFKSPNPNDPWGVRVSAKSLCLASYGLSGTRSMIEDTLKQLGFLVNPDSESISRVDFCMDFLIPGFELDPQNFVMHSRLTRKDYYEEERGYNVGCSNRFTSSTIGKMPGMQVILYDKTADVTAKRKKEWWRIWNTYRQAEGQALLTPENFKKSIWRIELRAGKHYLKERWNIRTWNDLDEKVSSLFQLISKQIRYCTPTNDDNRSRWPNSILWDHMQKELTFALPTDSIIEPNSVREVIREKLEEMLWSQHTGLAASWCNTYGFEPHDAENALKVVSDLYADMCEEDIEEFQKKMERAEKRYVFVA